MTINSVYVGNDPVAYAKSNAWAKGQFDGVTIFIGQANWNDFDGCVGWEVDLWATTEASRLWSIPLIVKGASLQLSADGVYDSHYIQAAEKLAAAQPNGPIYIRTGWEFNGDWFPWAAQDDPTTYIAAFRNFVDQFRSVSDRFVFDWNVNIGDVGMDPATAYPGDSYVDIISMDFYWFKNWDPQNPDAAWNSMVNRKWGLQWLEDFADDHGKPTAYPEWGVTTDNAGPYIAKAAAWFKAHDVVYQGYWDSNAAYAGKLSDGLLTGASAAFQANFAPKGVAGAISGNVGGVGADLIDLSASKFSFATGGNGNDAFYLGWNSLAVLKIDGGNGIDEVGLQGNLVGINKVVLGNDSLINIETLVLLSGHDTRFGDLFGRNYSYEIKIVDANVAAGQTLVVNMNALQANESVTFDGSAEKDGSFNFFGGFGADVLTGGAQSDGFFFGADGRFGATDRIVGGAGADDQLGLQGDYTLVFGANQLSGVESIVLLSAGANGANPFQYDLTLNDANAVGQTLTVNGNILKAAETMRVDGSAETESVLRLFGGAGDDILIGGAANDILYGNGGADRITGGMGADTLNGGAGADVFVYGAARESTGATYDKIIGFDFATDLLDVRGTAANYSRAPDARGALSSATLDGDLSALLGTSLSAGGVSMVTATGGTLDGHAFLVIDQNGVAGYQAGADLLIELVAPLNVAAGGVAFLI